MMRPLTLLFLVGVFSLQLHAQTPACVTKCKRIPLSEYSKGMRFYFPSKHLSSSDIIFSSRFSGPDTYSEIATKTYKIVDTSNFRNKLYYDRYQPGEKDSPGNDRIQKIYSFDLVNIADTTDKFTYTVSVDSAVFLATAPYPALQDNAYIIGAIALDEFEATRKCLANSTVYALFEIAGKKYEKGKITDVVYGTWETPLGIVYKADTRQTADTVYVNLCGTNVPGSYGSSFHFNNYFSWTTPGDNIAVERWNIIRSGEPVLGMNKNELLLALGKPRQVEETIEKDTRKGVYTFDKYVVHFENGKVIKIVSVTKN